MNKLSGHWVNSEEIHKLAKEKEGRGWKTLVIPARDKTQVAIAHPNDITADDAFAIAFERYEDALEELAKK